MDCLKIQVVKLKKTNKQKKTTFVNYSAAMDLWQLWFFVDTEFRIKALYPQGILLRMTDSFFNTTNDTLTP